MEIRIRTEWDDRAQVLGEVPFDQVAVDKVIPLLNRWGVSDDEGNSYDCEGQMIGQFKVTPTGAYFEVVLSEPDSE